MNRAIRIVGFVIDGVDTDTVRPFVAELLIISMMLVAHWRFNRENLHEP